MQGVQILYPQMLQLYTWSSCSTGHAFYLRIVRYKLMTYGNSKLVTKHHTMETYLLLN